MHGLSALFGYKTVGADNIRPPTRYVDAIGLSGGRNIQALRADDIRPYNPQTEQIGKNRHD